jgi:hypothetical protein
MEILLCFAAIATLVWFWADSVWAREQMLRRCRALCGELDFQLLDQTIGLVKLDLGRGAQGHVQLRRWYAFEYSVNGKDRWRGMAELRGRHIESIHMQHPDGPIIVQSRSRLKA